jgi:hypothetical protein
VYVCCDVEITRVRVPYIVRESTAWFGDSTPAAKREHELVSKVYFFEWVNLCRYAWDASF